MDLQHALQCKGLVTALSFVLLRTQTVDNSFAHNYIHAVLRKLAMHQAFLRLRLAWLQLWRAFGFLLFGRGVILATLSHR